MAASADVGADAAAKLSVNRQQLLRVAMAVLFEIDLSKPSHYATLGVDAKDFSEEQLKKNFRLLALKWHPDRNRGREEAAAERFKEVQTAHAVLADSKQRRAYDRSLLAARIAARRAQHLRCSQLR